MKIIFQIQAWCANGDDYVFYYKYGVGIIKILDNEEYQISDETAYSMAYKDGYIYYTTPNAVGGIDIRKLSHNGDELTTLVSVSSPSTKMYLVDNYLYYLTTEPDTISRIDINGENQINLISRGVSDFDISDETIYFTDNYGYLCKVDLNGENYAQITEDILTTKFQLYNGEIYYYQENSGLMKFDIEKKSSELVTDRVKSNVYNVTNRGIFFLDIDSMKICKISLNGNSYKELKEINTSNTKINVIGNELYYLDNYSEDNTSRTYRIKINGNESDQIEYQKGVLL